MSSTTQAESSTAAENRFLHLTGVNINFTARRPDYAIFVRISVEGQVYESHSFDGRTPVVWHGDIYVSSASSICITCHRQQTATKKVFKRKPYAELTVDPKSAQIEDGSTRSFADDRQRVSAELAFGQSIERTKALKLLGEGVSSALAGKVILLDKIGRISDFIEGVIKVGAAFAELNIVAKVAFGVAKAVFKALQRQHECHEAAVNLAEFVLDKLPVTEIIPEKLQNDLIRQSLEKILTITKEALDVLNNYVNGLTFNRELGAIRDMKTRLTDVSANLSLMLTAENNVMAQTIKERQEIDMLERLRAVPAARSSEGHSCLKDTRVEVLGDITSWSKSSSKLAWLHGFAGSGKSSIAATVCDELEAQDMLAGSFFCKRDVPEQREAGRILPSLSFTLCRLCKPYKDCIIKVLEKEPDLASRPVNYQLKTLFLDPFSELRQQNYSLERPIVFVIDALDECGTDDATRSRIARCLGQIAELANWLKVFVTSRPLPELMREFSPSPLRHSINLNDEDSNEDIMKYTKACLEELVELQGLDRKWLADDIIKALSHKASSLFIWTSTVMMFVRHSYDRDGAMEEIMTGQSESTLDTLYLTVIKSSDSRSNAVNFELMKAVLGFIHITAKNKPLSIDGLADLMPTIEGRRATKSALKAIVNDLRSVLYEDSSKGGVIRVCHPSFLDFLESQERCKDYWTSSVELDGTIIERCLMLMKTMLQFNICELDSSSVANEDVPNLEQRIRANIPESLQYCCLYWSTHLTEANRLIVKGLIEDFFGNLLVLYWLEVLSLIGGLRRGLDTLLAIEGVDENVIARDVYKLLSSSYDAISLSTPHLYISAMSWVPDESELKRVFYDRFANQPLISSGRNRTWNPALWLNSMEGLVWKVVFSPEGRHVAACSTGGTICIYEAKTGLLAMKLAGHSKAVYAISYSPDGKQLVSSSSDCTVRVWDMGTGTGIGEPLLGHTKAVTSVCYSPDGVYIASRSADRTVKIWDSVSKSEIRTMDGLSEPGEVVYSPDGRRLVCSALEGIIVRDAQSGDLMCELKIGYVHCLEYSPNGAYLAFGWVDGTVRLLDGETLAEVAVLEGHTGGIWSVAFSPDSSLLLSSSGDSTIITWDVASEEMIGTPLRAHGAEIISAAYSSDGSYIASGSYDKTVRVWDVRSISGAELSRAKHLFSIALSPGGEEFAAAGEDGDIRIRDVNTGAELRTLTGHTRSVLAMAYSPTGKLLASGSSDRTVRLWDTATGDELHKFDGHTSGISSIVFAPDGKHVFSASFDGTVRRWQTDSCDDQGELLVNHGSTVRAVCISPNGELLASGGGDNVIRFFDLHNRSVVEQQCISSGEIRSLVFSRDGKSVASGSYTDLIQTWDLDTYSEVRRLEGHTNSIYSLAFSFDGKLVLSSSADATVRLWYPQSGAGLCILNGHNSAVIGAGFTNDGRRIISASLDGTCRIWSSSVSQISPSCVPEHYREALSRPLPDGWIKAPTGELVLWVPPEYRDRIRDMCEICVPADAPGHPVRLDWSKLVKGDAWTSILKVEQA